MNIGADISLLKTVISENLRVQLGGARSIAYIDAAGIMALALSRNNHAIFGRRGTGKTLLLHELRKKLPQDVRVIYINCEDYKTHSFPNVLIEIMDKILNEMERNLFKWFGKSAALRTTLSKIRTELAEHKSSPDELTQAIATKDETASSLEAKLGTPAEVLGVSASLGGKVSDKSIYEAHYTLNDNKLTRLNLSLPKIKAHIGDFFQLTKKTSSIYILLDDFYQLNRYDQPFIADFVHRLCKDLSLFFKIATLRHATALYVDKNGQPFGAQERHDYQPIDVDFNLASFAQTKKQLRNILDALGQQAGWSPADISRVFKGEGFDRLVLASGGVPRDFLSFFLSFPLDEKSIGKDEVRLLSREAIEFRIRDLKQDTRDAEQSMLLRAAYAVRQFCVAKAVNVFLVSEQEMNNNDDLKQMMNRLLDYRIVHSVRPALTRKSGPGTFHAFMIDIGFYANLRKLQGKFTEYPITDSEALRNAPVMRADELIAAVEKAPQDNEVEASLLDDVGEE
jgi:hypothetical protein